MGSDSIDLSLKNIWKSWFEFRKGKKWSKELHEFQFHLERNLQELFHDLNTRKYRHGDYKKFTVTDNKKREISVAGIRDRVVHRLAYDHLVKIFDKTFIYDAWSCRTGKGLTGCIERTQKFLKYHPENYIWRADVQKFFDSVNQEILFKLLTRKIQDEKTAELLREIIFSFERERERDAGRGMPIGNLTSQIFANIYLNELDRLMKHDLKPKEYLRYGDDFIAIDSLKKLKFIQSETEEFLEQKLGLRFNRKNNIIIPANKGLKFLGVVMTPKSRKLNKRNWKRIKARLNGKNVGSYYGLVNKNENSERREQFNWEILNRFPDIQDFHFFQNQK